VADLDANLTVAHAYCDASRRGDAEAFVALAAPDAVVWHNADATEEPLVNAAKALTWLHRAVPDVDWTDRALTPTADGFVWRAVLTGTAPGGSLRVHTCVVVTLSGEGLVRRIDEYLDPAQTRVLSASS
jgi:ketosteroid isomerase-like protein